MLRQSRSSGFLWLLPPLLLAAVAVLFYPFRFVFELDADEGVNLIKSVLVSQGARLYTEVWSDQPPILTQLMAAMFHGFGVNLTAARLLMLLFSCGLLWAAVQYLRVDWGIPHAIAGGVILTLLPTYLRLSLSIMVGLPALALAMLSFLAIGYWHKQRNRRWLVLSGVALALSVMTKLFTGLLAPIFIAGLIIREARQDGPRRESLIPALVWALAFGAAALLSGIIFLGPTGLPQVLVNHWMARSVQLPQATTIAGTLREALPAILLGLIGSAYVIRLRRFTGLYLVAWALGGFLLLSQHSPIWYHHQLLITIPVGVLGGIAVGEFLVALGRRFRGLPIASAGAALHLAGAVLIPYFLVSSLPTTLRELDFHLPNLRLPNADARTIEAVDLLDVMREYADATQLIMTDRPMLAIWLGKPVPAEIAALTGKRLLTGDLSQSEFIAAIVRNQPEQVALARFELPQVDAYLQAHYRLVYQLRDHRHYVRGDLQVDSPRPESEGGD